jgi:hypothetical protein
MDIFYRYKSNIIAASITLLISGIFFLFLLITPGGGFSSFDKKTDLDKELDIQLQMLADIPLPSPQIEQTQTGNTNAKENQQPENLNNTENSGETLKNGEEVVESAKNDSVLLVDIKKTIEDINYKLPDDTVTKEVLKQEITNIAHPNTVSKKRTTYEDARFYYDNYRLINNLKFLYPYVMKTTEIVRKLDAQLSSINNKQERKRLIKETEKQLFAQYEKDVRSMSFYQGRLLLKLISRETNETAYGLIKTYKGGIPATFWYGVGLIFHEDIKAQYDSIGEDALLEKIVQKYKQGQLK